MLCIYFANIFLFSPYHHQPRLPPHTHTTYQLSQAKTIPEPRSDSLRDEATRLEPLLDWAIPEMRWLSHWNSKPKLITPVPGLFEQLPHGQKSLKITMAAPVADMVGRIKLRAGPRVIVAPTALPATLPEPRPSYSNARYPAEPTSRLGVGVLVAAKHPYEQW